MTTGSVWALPPRAPGLIMEEVGNEIVVVDPDTQRAHALSGLAARIFVASEDGRFTGDDDPAAVDAAVAGLVEAGGAGGTLALAGGGGGGVGTTGGGVSTNSWSAPTAPSVPGNPGQGGAAEGDGTDGYAWFSGIGITGA
jgi:hypothetical protein